MSMRKITGSFGVLVFCYILIIAISWSESPYQPVVTLLIGAILWLAVNKIPVNPNKYLVFGIVLVGCGIRFLWAILVPTLPVSDFSDFHEKALSLSQGVLAITKNNGFPLLLSAGYRIYPHVITGKLINAAASTVSMILVYWIGVRFASPKIGIVAAALFAFLPGEVMMVSVLGTEVLAAFCGILTIFCILNAAKNQHDISVKYTLAAGLVLGIGATIRVSLLFYLPVYVLWLLYKTFPAYKQIAKALALLLAGTAAGFGIFLIGYFLSTRQIALKALISQDSYPILSGTNDDSSGRWNQADADLYYSWPADKRDAFARQEAAERIKSDPGRFLLLILRKYNILMGENDDAVVWSLGAVDWGDGNLFQVRGTGKNNWKKYAHFQEFVMENSKLISQSVYIVLCFFIFWAGTKNRNDQLMFFGLGLILFTLLPHILVEVQGRYHHSIMPFLVLLAANGIVRDSTDHQEPLTSRQIPAENSRRNKPNAENSG